MYYELTCIGTEGVNRFYVNATEEEMAVFNRVLKSGIYCDCDWGGNLPIVTSTFNSLAEMYSHIFFNNYRRSNEK